MGARLLILALLAFSTASCASRSWEEKTDTFRATGPTTEYADVSPGADQFLRVESGVQSDGFRFWEEVMTDANGVAQVDFLPVALMVLYYRKDIAISVFRYDDEKVIDELVVDRMQAEEIISQRSTQVRLGGEVLLRKAYIIMLDELTAGEADAFTNKLKQLRVYTKERVDWE
ncbi:hypothetical protein OAU50_00685 [Planctomycetota bacterium]|nr:hypothetical protein [Planctomycetota bacterium]